MSDFGKYSRFEPPADRRERELWLIGQEERIARRVVNALAAIVEDATDAYVNSLTAAGDMGVFDGIPARWGLFVEDVLMDDLSGMYLSGGLTAWITADDVGRAPDRIATDFVRVINQNAATYALEATNRMSDVGLTTWNLIKDRVSKAVVSGESVDKTAKAIRENVGFAKKRAEMIARTETINAFNNGDWAGDQALGEFGPVYKYWVATLDDRGRPEHIAVNDVVKLMAEPFLVGGEEMLFPHSPGASAKNVVNCRCVYNKLWPGDPHPVTGEPMPSPEGWVDPAAQTQTTPTQPMSEMTRAEVIEQTSGKRFERGANATKKFSDSITVPKAQRGRLAERATAIDDTITILDDIHGVPSTYRELDVVLGGKSAAKGGHFSPMTAGPKPKRTRGISYEEYFAKMREYAARPLRAEIRVNDQDIAKQMNTMTHEVGHSVDWDGQTYRSRRAWASAEMRSLKSKYAAEWVDHVDEIADEEIRAFADLARAASKAESVKNYTRMSSVEYRQYFTSVEEVWARGYAQWVAEVSGDERLLSVMAKKKGTYQFTDDEFVEIRPIIERVLRVRGIIR